LGVFNDPKSLAKLLASVKVNDRKRPLTPIETAQYLQQGVVELGSVEDVMKRVDLKKSMWTGFQKLLDINEDIESSVIWGESNPETMELGFSVAHSIASLEPDDQVTLVNAMWEYKQPFPFEVIQKIKSIHKENPEKPLTDSISSVLKIELPANTIEIFISGLKTEIYENLKTISIKKNIPLEQFTKEVLSKHFSENSIHGIKISKNLIRIGFSKDGKKEFNKLTSNSRSIKNNFINSLLEKDGF